MMARNKFDRNEIRRSGELARISLYNQRNQVVGKAIVDSEDVERIKNLKWRMTAQGYAVTGTGKEQRSLAEIILETRTSKTIVVDHKNRRKLDNRKHNLRICNKGENAHNSKLREDNKSGFTGVHWDKSRKKWMAFVTIEKKRKQLGRFERKSDAVNARKGWIQNQQRISNHCGIPTTSRHDIDRRVDT